MLPIDPSNNVLISLIKINADANTFKDAVSINRQTVLQIRATDLFTARAIKARGKYFEKKQTKPDDLAENWAVVLKRQNEVKSKKREWSNGEDTAA